MHKRGFRLAAAVIAAFGAISLLAPAHAERVVQGYVCSERVHELTTSIDWHKNLHEAEQAAHQQGKLIFWVHMLGKVDGAT